MGVRLGKSILIVSAEELRKDPKARRDIESWDVAGVAVRNRRQTEITMMNVAEAKKIVELLQEAIAKAEPL